MNTVILGASAGLGRALAEELAARRHNLALCATDPRDLESLAADLSLRYGIGAHAVVVDLADMNPVAVRTKILDALGEVDVLACVAGYSDAGADSGPVRPDLADRLMATNFVGIVQLANAFLPDLRSNPAGAIIFVSSIAASRPRGRNTVYAASKRGLEFYAGTLRHYLAAWPCRVQLYRAGYLDTRMNFGESRLLPKWAPERAARVIADNMAKDIPLAYLPRWWRPVMIVYASIPWAIYKRIGM